MHYYADMKNPTIATILNLIPGLGYLYIGGKKTLFGCLLLVGMIVGALATFDPSLNLYSEESMKAEYTVWTLLAFLSFPLTIGAFMYDAYVTANDVNSKPHNKKK